MENSILSQIDVGFIFAIILVLETVKQVLKKTTKKKVPIWVWKLSVIGCGILASLFSSPVSFGMFAKGIFLYAAGATIVYQSAKPLVTKIAKSFLNGNTHNGNP